MKKKSLTLKELRKRWWWNREEIRRNGVQGVDWNAVEESARNYELMSRSPKGKQFSKTYLELDRGEKTIVHVLWVAPSQLPYRFVTNRSQFQERGWTPIHENEHRQWNLRVAPNILIREFIREITILQKIQKIRPQHPLEGKKYRGVSWKLIEVLDRKQNGIGKFNASQRHTLSVAQRQAAKYFAEYKRALARWEKIPKAAFDYEMSTEDNNPL